MPPKVRESEDEKNLRIRMNAVKRNAKDLEVTRREVVRERERLATMEEKGADRLTQQRNVVREGESMIPHTEGRLRAAVADLQALLDEGAVEGGELVEAAKNELRNAVAALEQSTN